MPTQQPIDAELSDVEVQLAALSRMFLVANGSESTSPVISRRDITRAVGRYFDGLRDVYESAGYPRVVDFAELFDRYNRQDIAGRVVDAPAEAAWHYMPTLLDGDDINDAAADGDFVQDWQWLTSLSDMHSETLEPLGLGLRLLEADRLSGIGGRSVIVLGVNDGQPVRSELAKGSATELAYVDAYLERDFGVVQTEMSPTSRRRGRPLLYQVHDRATGVSQDVHWTRVIEVVNNSGRSRMLGVLNRLIDLEKIMAGAGEAAWKLVDKGLILTTQPNTKLRPDTDGARAAAIDEYIHGLRRTLELQGMDATIAGGEVVDPSGLALLNVSFISAKTGIPRRILLGSEEGQLAGEQDSEHWAQVVSQHQRQHAEPQIVRPLVNRLVYAGVMRPPATGTYIVKWRDKIGRAHV